MSQKKPLLKIFNNLVGCFHLDGAGETVCSVTDFARVNNLPDDPRLRSIVIEELREMFPDVRILEEGS